MYLDEIRKFRIWKHLPMAMNISLTFIEVFADVSMKSKLLSSAYDCASYKGKPTLKSHSLR